MKRAELGANTNPVRSFGVLTGELGVCGRADNLVNVDRVAAELSSGEAAATRGTAR